MEVIGDKVKVAAGGLDRMLRGKDERPYQTCMLVIVCVISRTLLVVGFIRLALWRKWR